ncbi:MAG: hypothetical protein HQ474_05685 [Flammeovirgaceae bacterium]|jgi:hypothetical protein|nr:hypothetical protein [Flammeovirgaceae bacterium]
MVRIGQLSHAALVFTRCSCEMDLTGQKMTGFLFVDIKGFDAEKDLDFWISKALDYTQELGN